MKEKVGLVTCFLNNYGACLQAYALQIVLNEFSEKVEIIQYLEPDGYESKSIVHKLLFNPVSKLTASWFSKNYRRIYLFNKSCEKFKKKYLHFNATKYYTYNDLKENCPDFDVFVCGSDQIWNPTFYGGCNSAYYLDFAKDKKRVAYAPSIGVSSIDEKYRDEFIRLVSQMDVLSVREKTGSELIERYCGKKVKTVLDPTLLISGEEWSKKADESGICIKEKYIFCYLFGNRPFYRQFILKVSEQLNLPVYIIPFNYEQIHYGFNNVLDAGPLGFVKLIKNASFVITDSFHATAFSMNLNVPFYTLLRDEKTNPRNMNSRIIDILFSLGLNDRLWNDQNDFNKFTDEVNWDKSNNTLQRKREEDKNFLREAISIY